MMTNKGDNEKRLTCPYEPSHILLHYRMQTHLVKCRRNHPDQGVSICMFNAVHQVPTPELAYHYEVCPDRGNLDKYAIATENVNPDRFTIEQPDVQPLENWDNEEHPTYDPEEYCRNNLILRNSVINTQSSAVRRNFRMEERERHQDLINQRTTVNHASASRQEAAGRRPVGASEGAENRAEIGESDPFDIANLMAKVDLGSGTLTTPRLNPAGAAGSDDVTDETEPEDKNDKPVSRTQPAAAGNGTAAANGSTGAVRRASNGSTGAVPRVQNATSSGRERQVPSWPVGGTSGSQHGANKSSGWKPATSCALDEQHFPQLGAPRSAMARNVGRGRGSGLARK